MAKEVANGWAGLLRLDSHVYISITNGTESTAFEVYGISLGMEPEVHLLDLASDGKNIRDRRRDLKGANLRIGFVESPNLIEVGSSGTGEAHQ